MLEPQRVALRRSGGHVVVDRADALRLQRRAEYTRTVQAAFGEVLDALQGQQSLGSIEDSASERAAALSPTWHSP
jgi:hypothetical protein